MAKKTTLNDNYGIRVNSKAIKKFYNHCSSVLKRPHQEVTREIMAAAVDGRLKITPTEDQKKAQDSLYS